MIAALVDPTTGQIHAFTMPANESDILEGSMQGGLQVRWDTQNVFIDDLAGHATDSYYYDGNPETRFIELATKPSVHHVYNWTSYAWEFDSADFSTRMRADRDLKLGISDWTQNADSPLTDAKKAEWVTYRQSLRNFPAVNASATDYDALVWPTQPS
jgi:hypothetical protein|tara:strand:+ start:209 stop:679 length:471 start_codon:yes stop_codon:yes gene_type:complete